MEFDWDSVRHALRSVLEQEMGLGRFEMARRFEGGKLILQPFDPAHKPKELPLDQFFKKITAVREKLRVLEQKLNHHEHLSEIDKAEFQQYITRCYGSLTTFNVLFAEEDDKFVGMKGED